MAAIKSAYELALERMEQDGIERPRAEAFSDETLEEMAAVRSRAEARLAELEILHRDRVRKLHPSECGEEDSDYRRERRRIEDDRDRKLDSLRQAAPGGEL